MGLVCCRFLRGHGQRKAPRDAQTATKGVNIPAHEALHELVPRPRYAVPDKLQLVAPWASAQQRMLSGVVLAAKTDMRFSAALLLTLSLSLATVICLEASLQLACHASAFCKILPAFHVPPKACSSKPTCKASCTVPRSKHKAPEMTSSQSQSTLRVLSPVRLGLPTLHCCCRRCPRVVLLFLDVLGCCCGCCCGGGGGGYCCCCRPHGQPYACVIGHMSHPKACARFCVCWLPATLQLAPCRALGCR